MHGQHYLQLLIMSVLSFISMYILMYAMVDRFENVYPNFNQFYMAALMTAPMVIIELLLMRSMYKNSTANMAILAVGVVALGTFWFMIRDQTAVGDVQFLKSMIPHHAGAVLMCEQAPIEDGAVRELCKSIIASQQEEIAQMKGMLARLEKR
jgi:uncharacterized protein (DUF305 family)